MTHPDPIVAAALRVLLVVAVLGLSRCSEESVSAPDTAGEPADVAAPPDSAADVVPPDALEGTDSTAPDADVGDSQQEAPPATCDSPPFAPHCACTGSGQCLGGECVPTIFGGVCPVAEHCLDVCQSGWNCAPFRHGMDVAYECRYRYDRVCLPCESDADCQTEQRPLWEGTSLCLDYGAAGRFCGAPCQYDVNCAVCFDCIAEPGQDGQCWGRRVGEQRVCPPRASEDVFVVE